MSAPSQWHTILSDGKRPELLRAKEERERIELHVGRFILAWGFVDFSLSMAVAAWAGPGRGSRLQHPLFGAPTAPKIDMLESLLPDDWRDGKALIKFLREGNSYRNTIAHFSLAMGGQDGGVSLGWHFWKVKGRKTKRLEIDARSIERQNLRADVLKEAVHSLLRGTFMSNDGNLNDESLSHAICHAPGGWDTREDFDAFQAMARKMFPG